MSGSLLHFPQMTFLVSDQALFVCNRISLDRDLDTIARIAECAGIPQSKIARKKLAKANSVLQKYLI